MQRGSIPPPKALNEQERLVLREYLWLLLEADELNAFLGVLRRIAERKAFSLVRKIEGVDDGERWQAAEKWQIMADVILKIQDGMRDR